MNLAIFGDVHANLEALDAVLKDARAQGCTEFACTGDLVGYNANPNECVEMVRELDCPVVRGNHDEDGAGFHPLIGLSRKAHRSLLWTREVLTDENREWLSNLPYELQVYDTTLVHATLDRPDRWGYILNGATALRSFRYQLDTVCFHGHTHLPMIYLLDDEGKLGLEYEQIEVELTCRYLVNVGSVGKPRQMDQRACYAIYDTETATIALRRVDYEDEVAFRKSENAGLLV